MSSTKVSASLTSMAKSSLAEMPVHSNLHFWEKENDHSGLLRKCGRKQKNCDVTEVDEVTTRLPLLGLAPTGQRTALLKPSTASGKFLRSPSPDSLTPTGTCTPMLSPYLKELSSPSPSPLNLSKLRSIKEPIRPVRKVAPASLARVNTPSVGDVQDQVKSAQNPLPARPKPGARSVVRVRARRALMLQSEDKSKPSPGHQVSNRRSVCSKSVGDLNLSAACLQSAARANLSCSADGPASSAACTRKRSDEESGYEVKRKSLRHEDQSQSWHSTTACLAQLSLQGKERHVSFGKATVFGPV